MLSVKKWNKRLFKYYIIIYVYIAIVDDMATSNRGKFVIVPQLLKLNETGPYHCSHFALVSFTKRYGRIL